MTIVLLNNFSECEDFLFFVCTNCKQHRIIRTSGCCSGYFLGGNNVTKTKNELIRVIPLGGVGEIGKAMYVIEIDEELFVVDSGLMFPEDEMLGIDIVIPDITYLEENKDRVKGIFLTHGHEDAIGSIAYVLRKINC